jgi:hypothetical protein
MNLGKKYNEWDLFVMALYKCVGIFISIYYSRLRNGKTPMALKTFTTSSKGDTHQNLLLKWCTIFRLFLVVLILKVHFSVAGHIAHLNLTDELLPYRNVIAEVFLDVSGFNMSYLCSICYL